MKKLYASIVILISILISVLLLLDFDKKQQESLYLYSISKINTNVTVQGFDDIDFNTEAHNFLDSLASELDIKVFVSHYDYQENVLKLFFSSNLHEQIKQILGVSGSVSLPYCTFGDAANVDDMLHNDRLIYDSLALMNDSNFYWDGTIKLGYETERQLDKFVEQFSDHFSLDASALTYSVRLYRETGQLLNLVLGFSAFSLLFLMVVIVVQRINSSSSKIGVFLLNGYDNLGVVKKLFGSDYRFFLIGMLFSALMFFVLPDIPISLLLVLWAKDIVLLVITFVIYYLFLRFALKTKKISSILKKQQIAHKLSSFNVWLQIVVSCLILVILLLSTVYIENVLINTQDRKKYEYLLDYGVIRSIDTDFLSSSKDITFELHNEIINNELLKNKYLYAKFEKYHVYMPGVIVSPSYKYDDLYAVVSPNYFELEGVLLYDEFGQLVELENSYESEDIFVFPKSIESTEKIVESYFNTSLDLYDNDRSNYKPRILYYEDRILNTYDLDFLQVDSPNFKIVRTDESRMWGEHGLSLYAVGMDTLMKFLVEGDQQIVIDELSSIFADVGAPEAFRDNHFVTYGNYLGEDLQRNQTAIQTILMGGFVIFLLFVFVQFQFVSLFIICNYREITIKKYLGHKLDSIYKNIIKATIMVFIISLTIVIFINLVFKLGDWVIFGGLSLVFILLSIGITVAMVTFINQQKLSKSLKGGND